MTGPLERPSQGAPENRKAEIRERSQSDVLRAARRAFASISVAEMQVLVAAQRDERSRALAAIDAGLRSQHASQTAAVVARFADRRAALDQITDAGARAAAAHRLAAEETAELARLALEHAAEKRRLKTSIVSSLAVTHRAEQRRLRLNQRRQRMGTAVRLQQLRPRMRSNETRTPAVHSRHIAHWRWPSGKA